MNQNMTPPPPPMQPQTPRPKKKKRVWMWIIIIIIGFPILGAIFGEPTSEDGIHKDSETSVQQEKTDSAATPTKDPEKIKQLKAKFTTKTDEFTNCTWVTPKSKPKYRNTTGIYSYFAIEDSVPQNMRFVIQYGSDDWLFIQSYTFLIDGKTYEFSNPVVERDNNSSIWEWSDTNVLQDRELLIIYARLLEAKDAKIRFSGRQYKYDYTIPTSALQSLRDTKDYYVALGGK